jgi:transcriptional regulator with XRE-family HTH domain
MEKRLLELLRLEGLNSTRFAEKIGVQRSSISHILSGRNKPSYDFIIKILESFPMLNPDWLLRGKGLMYLQDRLVQRDLFDVIDKNISEKVGYSEKETDEIEQKNQIEINAESKMNISENHDFTTRNIERIVVFYDDGSFSHYKPSQN